MWAAGIVALVGLFGSAVAWGMAALPVAALLAAVGLAGAWGGWRMRSRNRLYAAMDAFAERELARRH